MTTLLRWRAVSYGVGGDSVLDSVSGHVQAGECVTVLGPSGAGKSTLMRLGALLAKPLEGHVEVFGQGALDTKQRISVLRRTGYVQQRPGLLRASVVDNVAYPLHVRGVPRGVARSQALVALEQAGLGPLAQAPASQLSGGEGQRLALARATVAEPDLLLLDEPTNQLDPAWTRRVEDLVGRRRQRGVGVAWVTHSVTQARRVSTRFVFLSRGKVVEAGPISALDSPKTAELASFLEFS